VLDWNNETIDKMSSAMLRFFYWFATLGFIASLVELILKSVGHNLTTDVSEVL